MGRDAVKAILVAVPPLFLVGLAPPSLRAPRPTTRSPDHLMDAAARHASRVGLLDPDRAQGERADIAARRLASPGTGAAIATGSATNTEYRWLATTHRMRRQSRRGRSRGVTYTHNIGLAVFADLGKLLGLDDTAFLVSVRTGPETACPTSNRQTSTPCSRSTAARRRGWFNSHWARPSSTASCASSPGASMASTTSSPRRSTATRRTWPSAAIRSAFRPTSTSPATRTPCGARACAGNRLALVCDGRVVNADAGFRANASHGTDFSIRHNSGVIGIMELASSRKRWELCPRICRDTSRWAATTTPSH